MDKANNIKCIYIIFIKKFYSILHWIVYSVIEYKQMKKPKSPRVFK